MKDKQKVRKLLGCKDCPTRVKCNKLQKDNHYECIFFYIVESAMKWKEQKMIKKFIDVLHKYTNLDKWQYDKIKQIMNE